MKGKGYEGKKKTNEANIFLVSVMKTVALQQVL